MDACTQVGTPLLCAESQESESTVLAEVECWHPLATANGSALRERSGTVFQFSPSRYHERLCNSFRHVECEHRLATETPVKTQCEGFLSINDACTQVGTSLLCAESPG